MIGCRTRVGHECGEGPGSWAEKNQKLRCNLGRIRVVGLQQTRYYAVEGGEKGSMHALSLGFGAEWRPGKGLKMVPRARSQSEAVG